MSAEIGRIGAHTDLATIMRLTARRRAIIGLDKEQAVLCQQPGCHHRVYAAVHVVQESNTYLVLGSTCFAKRYGGTKALGTAQYSGSSRTLSDAERGLLIANTAALIAKLEEDDRLRDAALVEAAHRLAERRASTASAPQREFELRRVTYFPGVPTPAVLPSGRPSASPWPWQSTQLTSVAVMTAPDGRLWVRVQHQDGSQKLVPWPAFPGWEAALPAVLGPPDLEVAGYAVNDIVSALQLLQSLGFSRPKVGRWRDVLPQLR